MKQNGLYTVSSTIDLEFEPEESGRESFGSCPACGQSDGYLNVGPDHWVVCHAHKKAWWIGSKLLTYI